MASKEMQIRINKNFFLSSSALFGDIFFELEDDFFPDKDWNDFVVAMLIDWLSSILRLNMEKQCELIFLDGSYEVLVTLNDEQQCEMSFIERFVEAKDVLKTVILPIKDLVDKVLGACEDLFEAIENAESLKSLDGKDMDPKQLLTKIKKNPRISEDYEKLKIRYRSLRKQRELMKG